MFLIYFFYIEIDSSTLVFVAGGEPWYGGLDLKDKIKVSEKTSNRTYSFWTLNFSGRRVSWLLAVHSQSCCIGPCAKCPDVQTFLQVLLSNFTLPDINIQNWYWFEILHRYKEPNAKVRKNCFLNFFSLCKCLTWQLTVPPKLPIHWNPFWILLIWDNFCPTRQSTMPLSCTSSTRCFLTPTS